MEKHTLICAVILFCSTQCKSEDEESLDSIQEPEYPNVDLVESNHRLYAAVTAERDSDYQSNFSMTDEAEKRRLLRRCRDVARQLNDDIHSTKNSASSGSTVGDFRTPISQYSEDTESVVIT